MRKILTTLTRIFLPLLIAFYSPVSLADEVRITHDGVVLNANLETVDAGLNAAPTVLITHGTIAHAGMEIISGLQDLLAERGINSLAINLSLGISDRAQSMYDCAVRHTHKHVDAMGEIGAWYDWLKAEGATHIAVLGHSRGGNQTARFAAAQEDGAITAAILIAPMTWSEEYANKDYKKNYGVELAPLLAKAEALVAAGKGDEVMKPVDFIYCKQTEATAAAFVGYYRPDADFDTPHVVSRIKAPVLVVAGSADTVVHDLIAKMEPLADGDHIKLEVIDGADHFFRDLYLEDVADLIAEQIGG